MSNVLRDFVGDWHALVVLLLAGVIPNQIWRMLGLWLGGGLDEGSDLLMWVKAVATSILAGVIAEILVRPPGGAGERSRFSALQRAGCRFHRFHADAALDLCGRRFRRSRDAGRKMVAWLMAPLLV